MKIQHIYYSESINEFIVVNLKPPEVKADEVNVFQFLVGGKVLLNDLIYISTL